VRLSAGKYDARPLAIACAAVSSFLNLYSPQAILPLLAEEFGATPARVSMTLTACTVGVALVAPFSGAIADVLGRKRVIVAAMLALVIPTILTGLAPDLMTLTFWRFVQGLLLPPIFAVVIAYVSEEWPPAQATAVTGLYTSAAGFGGFLGRFLTGLMADWIGWRAAFIIDGLITLGLALAVLTLLPREQRFVGASNLAAALRQMIRHLRNPKLLATYAVGFGVLFNFIAVFTYVSFLLAAPPYSLSAALLGSIFVVYLLGTVLTPLTGRGVTRLGRRGFGLGALAAWACGLALMLAPSLPLIILGLALCAGAGFLCQAASTSFVAITAKEGPSSAVGLYVTAFYVGGSVGAVAGGAAWNAGHWPAVVGMAAVVLLGMAAIVGTAWPRRA
jgi:MFS transporter, YNFM family, putative membrane transport protein